MEGTCRLKRFLQKEHTPAEKAMLVSAAALIGAAAGIILGYLPKRFFVSHFFLQIKLKFF